MRRRILLMTAVTLLLMLGIMWLTTRTILMRGFEDMERSMMQENIERVRAAAQRDLGVLASTANDWGVWDETYDFLQSLDQLYVDVNLGDETLVYLDLDVLAILDIELRIAYAKSLGARPSGLEALPDRYPALFAQPTTGTAPVAGLGVLDGEPWLLAAHAVMTSEGKGPSRGWLLIGRRIDAKELDSLSSRVRLDVRVAARDRLEPDDPAKVLDGLKGSTTWIMERPAVDRLVAYATLADLRGDDALAVEVGAASEIHVQAGRITVGSMAWIALSGVAFGAVILVFISRRVLARLHSLSSQVLAIKTADEPSRRLEMGGKDEMAYLAAAINGMLADLESSTQELRAAERRTQAFLDVIPDAILLVARDETVRDVRIPPGWSLPGLSDQLRGMKLPALGAIFPSVREADRERLAAATAAAHETQAPQIVEIDVDGPQSPRSLEVRVASTATGETVYVGCDTTVRRQAERAERNEILLKEIHHRVRNNLQLISSLLGLQAGSTDDVGARAILAESQDRIRSMALIHERLTQTCGVGESGFAAYIRDLVEHLGRSYAGTTPGVEVVTRIEDVALPTDASLPVGLITSELLTNALRHAFPEGQRGHIEVTLDHGPEGTVVLCIRDDGIGLPDHVDPATAATLGFRIVATLVRQLKASLEVSRGAGTTFRLVLASP